jgi:ABC-type transport system involved in cytochrome bd biosynthesis fused ATPase/permease subunit
VSQRARLEQLQAQREALKQTLARGDEVALDRRLERAAHQLRQTLERREARQDARSTSQRVSAFGFQLLVVGPIVTMVGSAAGRALRGEDWAAAACLVVGALLVAVVLVPPLARRVMRVTSKGWRLLARAEALRRER